MSKFRSITTRFIPNYHCYSRVVEEKCYDSFSKKPVVVGSRDLVAFIDAPREDCEVYSKIHRFANGDLSALGNGNQQGVYTDVSGIPTDYNTIMNSVKIAHNQVMQSGAKSIEDYLNSAFEQARIDFEKNNPNFTADVDKPAEVKKSEV